MDKEKIAIDIYNDLVDEVFHDDFNELIDNRDEVLKIIQERLSSYLIVSGGNILTDKKGRARY